MKIELLADETLILPEYKIHLLNKSKKIINVIENINYIKEKKIDKKKFVKSKEKKDTRKIKKDTKKSKSKKKLRTLWIRRKKKLN